MEAWYAHLPARWWSLHRRQPPHPWTVYVADAIHVDLELAVGALLTAPGAEGLHLV